LQVRDERCGFGGPFDRAHARGPHLARQALEGGAAPVGDRRAGIVGGLLYARRDTLPFETAIVLGLLLLPVILMENRRARAWPLEIDSIAIDDEPAIGDIPELAPEIVPALDFQPVIRVDPASTGGNASPTQP
jgi:hypothetical protein